MTIAEKIERYFVWIILAIAALALYQPSYFIGIKPYISFLLGIIMFGIGFTLETHDFKKVWDKRWLALLAAAVKYILMPITAFLLGKLFKLPMEDVIGLVILGSCPGGTAANIMSYLSRSNVAFTVVLTFITTFLAPLLMPSLIFLFLHKQITVPFFSMFEHILFIVTIPLLFGLILKKCAKQKLDKISHVFPVISIFAVALIVACIIGLTQKKILAFPGLIILSVLLLNALGYVYGFLFAKIAGCNQRDGRAIAFEYAMQDSGLGVVIATSFFGPAAALASALFSLIQNITGPAVVNYLRKHSIARK